jgi:hypothetical protein
MNNCLHRLYVRLQWRWLTPLWVAFICISPSIEIANAQPDPIQVHETQVKAIAVRRQSQETEEKWDRLKGELKARYQALSSEKKNLENEKAVIEKQIAILKHRQAQSDRKITETALIRDNLHYHLDEVITRLEDSIGQGLPFLMQERTERLKRIRDTMLQPGVSIAEKCRQVMEALKIETEYGRNVEVYQEPLRFDHSADTPPIVADILRMGRLGLFWRTPDGETVGHWDRVDGKWSVLPGKYRRPINDAMEMALKQRTIDMVKLPLGRIVAQ